MHGSDIYTEVSSAILDTTGLWVLLQKNAVSDATHGLSMCPMQISIIILGNSNMHLGYNRPLHQCHAQILDNFKSYILGTIKSTKEDERL